MSIPSIENNAFRELLYRPSVAKEFLLPYEHARWDGDSYTLGQADKKRFRPEYSGVRLQAADANDPNQVVEKQCQSDLRKLVSSVREIRQEKALPGVVLSNELVLGRQPGSLCKRAIFGLHRPADDRFRDDTKAAEECQRQINRAVTKAGLRIERPGLFDPKTGMKGLEEWAGSVRLGHNPWPISPWWLLLIGLLPLFLLLLFLLFRGASNQNPQLPPDKGTPITFGGKIVDTDSFLILVDKSGSMTPFFPLIREETKRLLNERITRPKTESYADIIVYDQNAGSALGDMMKVNNGVADRLVAYIDNLKAGGGTNLESAIQLAGQRVQKHGKETTLLIVTDGEDSSIPKMLQDPGTAKGCFGNVKVNALWTTPRLLKQGANPLPQDNWERDLQRFVDIFKDR